MSTQIEKNNLAEKLLNDIGIKREVPRLVKAFEEIYKCGNAQDSTIQIKNGKGMLIEGKPCPLTQQPCVKISTCDNVYHQRSLIGVRKKARRFEDKD